MKHVISYLILLIAIPAVGNAQKLRFERLSVENGLQNNIVLAATEDGKGLLWFATTTGVDRYDGSQVRHYALPQNDGTYSEYGQVSFITTDASKNVWAAGPNAVYYYNIQTDQFVFNSRLNQELKKGHPLSFFSTGYDGKNILLGFNSGLAVYNIETNKVVYAENFNQFVRCVYQDAGGIIWAGTNQGIKRFTLNDSKLVQLDNGPGAVAMLNKEVLSTITQDVRQRYWLTTITGSIYIYDAGAGTCAPLTVPGFAANRYAVKKVLQNKQDRTSIVALDGGGVIVFNDSPAVVASYQSNEDDLGSLSNNAAYDVFIDSYNRTWVTTYGGGVNMSIIEIQAFHNFSHQVNNNQSLSNNAAKAAIEDADGNLWLGTRKGLSIFNPTAKTWWHINEEAYGNSFNSDNVLCLENDKLGLIWVGTYGGGIFQIETKTKKITHFLSDTGNIATLGTNYVYTLLYDSKERLWAAGIRGTLSYLDKKTGKFVRIVTPVATINCLLEDAAGDILAGTEKGVYRVAGNSLVSLLPAPTTEKVVCMSEKSPGVYWVGTIGKGLSLLSKKNGIEKRYTTLNGLPSDVICAILPGGNGNLWLGTSRGIVDFIVDKNEFTTYTQADGLAGSQVNYGAAYKTSKGELIFGTTNGFSIFDPALIQRKGFVPRIVFTGLIVNNKRIAASEPESIIKSQLDEIDELKLKYFQNSFSIDFVNTSPSFSGKHLYSWKLEGFDKEWSQPSTTPIATYTNLETGRYTLLVKAFSKGQQNNITIRKLPIHILPPWWLTGWALLGYLFLLAAALYAVWGYWRIKVARGKFAERLRLNTAISHEIRTPLTLIKGPINALENAEGLSENNRENIKLAQKNINKLEAIISQFIDFQKTGMGKLQMQVSRQDITALLDDVIASFVPLMKEKNIHFTYKKTSEKVELLFDREKMEKVFNNLLSNAVKYTPPNNDIAVEVTKEAKYLVICFSDTGIGIPAKQQQFLLKGYYRADNATNSREPGSGVGLGVANELIDLHFGKLNFVSTEGKGSAFTIKLLLQNEQLEKFTNSGFFEPDPLVPRTVQKNISTSENKKILVAEDNDELRNYLIKELQALGYKVMAAPDGKKALELAMVQIPDIIITDLMMPELNGFQLCTILKNNLVTSHIPIIILTAINDRDYLLEGYRSGADDYVKKPFDMAYITTRVENLLQNQVRFQNKIMNIFEQDETIVKEDQDILWLKKVTEHIVNNIDNAGFTVEKLAMDMAVSRPVLFRRFKQITGEAPQQYIAKIKMRRAAELLQMQTYNIGEIAYMTGFEDSKYFSTVFKKHFGTSPTEYLKKSAE